MRTPNPDPALGPARSHASPLQTPRPAAAGAVAAAALPT
jgi:hypothetical protein